MKALDFLTKYFEMHPEAKHRREFEQKKLEIEMLRLENQLKENVEEEVEESGFTEALNASAREVWDGD